MTYKTESSIQKLDESHLPQILDVFCDAFHDYPVMKVVIGSAGEKYDKHLRLLIKLFVMKRIMKEDPILGFIREGIVKACVTITSPHHKSADDRFNEFEKSIWDELGPEPQSRHKAICKLWNKFRMEKRHYHVNMIGVHSKFKKQGLGSTLLEAVHHMSYDNPDSCGVTLTTEDPTNVPFYKHHGYSIEANFVFSEKLKTWWFFRQDS